MEPTGQKRGMLADSVAMQDDATLLDYEILPQPNPLQAGEPAVLTLAVSNHRRTWITCSSITLTIRVGTNARDLVGDATGITSAAPPGWNVAQAEGTFTLTPNTPADGRIGPSGLSFVFARLVINGEVGVTVVAIDEMAAPGQEPPEERSGTIPLPKFPSEFTLSDLAVNPREVPAGNAATVNWSGWAQASYVLEFDAGSGRQVLPVGNLGPYVAESLTRYPEVLFTLMASYAAPGQDQPVVVQKQAAVQVDLPPPVVTSFRGHAAAGRASFDWATRNADSCTMNALPQLLNASGHAGPLATDRIRYTLVANSSRKATSSAPSYVDLRMSVVRQHSLDGQARWLGMTSAGSSLVAVLTSSGSADVRAVDPTTLSVANTVSYRFLGPISALSPDGTRFLVFAEHVSGVLLTTLAVPSLEEIWRTQPPIQPLGAAYSPDGATLYVAGWGGWVGSPSSVHVFDANGGWQRSFSVPDAGECAVSADGSRLYVAGRQQLLIVDPATGTVLRTPAIGGNDAGKIVVDGGRNRAYVSCQNAGTVAIVDLAAMTTLSQVTVGKRPLPIAIGLSGDEIYVGNAASSSITVIDANTLTVIATFALPDNPVGLAFAPGTPMQLYVLTQGTTTAASLCVLEATA